MRFWNSYSEKFNTLSSREKWLISLGGLVALFFVLLTLLIDPVVNANRISERRISRDIGQIKALKAQVRQISDELKKDPDKEVDAMRKKLHTKSQELSLELSELVSQLLTPGQMSELLESVLDSSKGLKLISLESQPAKSILQNKEQSAVNYYIHPVRIVLTGEYFQIKNYLKELEELPMKYFWEGFNYQVEEYPQARLILNVYTLGTRQEFIGG